MAPSSLPERLFSSLRARLLFLIIVAILPVIVVKLYNAQVQRENMAEQVQADALTISRLVATNQGEFVGFTRQLLTTLARLPAIQEGDLDVCNDFLAQILPQFPVYTNLYTIDLDGGSVCSGLPAEPGSVRVGDQRWFQRTVETGEFVVGNYEQGELTGLAILPIALPIFDNDGVMTGIVGAGLSLAWFDDFLGSTDLPPGGVLAAVDKEGTIVAIYPSEGLEQAVGVNAADNPLFQIIRQTSEGTTRFEAANGSPLLMGYTELGDDETGLYIAMLVPEAAALAETNALQNQLLTLLLGTTVIVLMVTAFGSRQLLLDPIQKLADATTRLGGGDLRSRVSEQSGIKELDALAHSLNEMAATLERREEQLQVTNEELQDEIEERRQAEEELKRFTIQLESSNQELEQFAYVASHDLQEPLRVIAGYLQLLERRYKGRLDSDADEFIAFAVDAAKRMQNLINDLLAYSRIGRKTRPFEQIDANQLVTEARSNIEMLVEETGTQIEVGDLPTVMADPVQLMLVFQNLIANGIKFHGDEPPLIQIGVHDCDTEWEFFVRDNGIGIDPKYSQRIFLIFQRLHTREEYPGTGIGLAICQKIIDYHGGRIWLDSEPGKGTTFFFTMPKQQEESA